MEEKKYVITGWGVSDVKPFIYPELSQSQIVDKRRELCAELEEITAQLSGQLIESALECARLKQALSAIIEGGRTSDNKRALYLVEIARTALFFGVREALQGKGE
jgi:hypothetical protein